MTTDVGIVGAGVCGLWVARALHDHKVTTCVLEKSRGVGGRLATRRTAGATFDHGAQFYVLKPESRGPHAAWDAAGLVKPWIDANTFCAPNGMTALAKLLARDLKPRFERRAERIARAGDGWTVHTDHDQSFTVRRLVLTCPVPQSIELLRASQIEFDPTLGEIAYHKAVVGLFEGTPSLAQGYVADPVADISSIADQHAKGVSAAPAWTVTMTSKFSTEHFDRPADQTLAEISARVRALDPSFAPAAAQLKTWRYAQPVEAGGKAYVEVAPNLFLAGDGFGGGSINGALRSATGLIERLTQKV